MKNYEDIINLNHYELRYHPRMSINNRSAQFAPFSALTGYDEEVKETARLTDDEKELSEEIKEQLNYKLQILESHIIDNPLVNVTYSKKDEKKSGGKYLEYSGKIKKIDIINGKLIFNNGIKINIRNITEISSMILDDKI